MAQLVRSLKDLPKPLEDLILDYNHEMYKGKLMNTLEYQINKIKKLEKEKFVMVRDGVFGVNENKIKHHTYYGKKIAQKLMRNGYLDIVRSIVPREYYSIWNPKTHKDRLMY